MPPAKAPGSRAVGVPLALVCALAGACGSDPGAGRPPDVVLVTLESLRTDHVGFQGAERPLTPELDALAAQAMVYTDAHSVTSWTLASHASLFTGLYPAAHATTKPLGRLADGYTTLAERLRDAGYQTAAVVSGPYLRRPHNLHQGFEHFDASPSAATQLEAHADVTSPALTAALRRFLEQERDPERPLFLFAYYWDPHFDYLPPPPWNERWVDGESEPVDLRGYETRDVVGPDIRPGELDYVLSQYDGEIGWTDHHLGLLFEELRSAGLWDPSLIVVTADHGEEFFEHGEKGHKRNLYAETVRVPLVVKHPEGEPRGRDARPVSLVDVAPTVLEAAGLPVPDGMQGRSLLAPVGSDGTGGAERPIFFELDSVWYLLRPGEERPSRSEERWLAVRRGDWKLVTVPSAGRVELYDVAADPGERNDVRSSHPEIVRELLALLAEQQERSADVAARLADDGRADLDADELERLRALGYVR